MTPACALPEHLLLQGLRNALLVLRDRPTPIPIHLHHAMHVLRATSLWKDKFHARRALLERLTPTQMQQPLASNVFRGNTQPRQP